MLDNIRAVLKAEGLAFDHIVKTTIFLTDLADFQAVNEVYGSYFQNKRRPLARPSKSRLLPKGARVENRSNCRGRWREFWRNGRADTSG